MIRKTVFYCKHDDMVFLQQARMVWCCSAFLKAIHACNKTHHVITLIAVRKEGADHFDRDGTAAPPTLLFEAIQAHDNKSHRHVCSRRRELPHSKTSFLKVLVWNVLTLSVKIKLWRGASIKLRHPAPSHCTKMELWRGVERPQSL